MLRKNGKEIAIGSIPVLILFLIYIGMNVIPILMLGVLGFIVFNMAGGRSKMTARTASKRRVKNSSNPFTFDQIGGQDQAKQELIESLDFLKYNDRISKLGIRPLKGILLSGPPGTGKTLLAKASAHYTDSVFLAAAGSEFVEMYVGVGASRIRDLFKEARTKASKDGKSSAVIFIDEIEVIGGKRDSGQQREYDQTLNQLLTEMDGIYEDESPRILLIAATNRKEMLDSALLRPGRFDRHIDVDLPDKKSRLHILRIHANNKPIADDVNLETIAQESYGFSGAQLESLMNEAAIYAMRSDEAVIASEHLSMAIDKVLMGEKTNRESTKEERERVALHELGHAIMAELLRPESVSQVTLSPRGKALGYVRHNPQQDQYLYTKTYLNNQIMIALGGAAAEEIFYGERSTGSRNDFEQSMNIVKTLVDSGLTELGIIDSSMLTKEAYSSVSGRILDELMDETKRMLEQRRTVFLQSLETLLREETLSGKQFRTLLAQCSAA